MTWPPGTRVPDVVQHQAEITSPRVNVDNAPAVRRPSGALRRLHGTGGGSRSSVWLGRFISPTRDQCADRSAGTARWHDQPGHRRHHRSRRPVHGGPASMIFRPLGYAALRSSANSCSCSLDNEVFRIRPPNGLSASVNLSSVRSPLMITTAALPGLSSD